MSRFSDVTLEDALIAQAEADAAEIAGKRRLSDDVVLALETFHQNDALAQREWSMDLVKKAPAVVLKVECGYTKVFVEGALAKRLPAGWRMLVRRHFKDRHITTYEFVEDE